MALGSKEDLRVLIAMENGQVALGARTVFKDQKVATVQVAEGKQDALDKMQAVAFNLLLIEDTFSDLGGVDFVRFVRMTNTTMAVAPVLLAMKDPNRERVMEARDAGVNKMVIMPFTGAVLLKNLADIMLNPRPFIRVTGYSGPCRRLQAKAIPGPDRRKVDEGQLSVEKLQKIFKGM